MKRREKYYHKSILNSGIRPLRPVPGRPYLPRVSIQYPKVPMVPLPYNPMTLLGLIGELFQSVSSILRD